MKRDHLPATICDFPCRNSIPEVTAKAPRRTAEFAKEWNVPRSLHIKLLYLLLSPYPLTDLQSTWMLRPSLIAFRLQTPDSHSFPSSPTSNSISHRQHALPHGESQKLNNSEAAIPPPPPPFRSGHWGQRMRKPRSRSQGTLKHKDDSES